MDNITCAQCGRNDCPSTPEQIATVVRDLEHDGHYTIIRTDGALLLLQVAEPSKQQPHWMCVACLASPE